MGILRKYKYLRLCNAKNKLDMKSVKIIMNQLNVEGKHIHVCLNFYYKIASLHIDHDNN
jgi:hypothetical protein